MANDDTIDDNAGTVEGHGGHLALAALQRFGVTELYTLSGGHIFPFYDAAVARGVRIVDVRHEQTATFAAEGVAKLTRKPGVAVLTAGPGITNGVSATASAWFNGSPLVVLGGRAPQARWGAGSLQEFDHVPVYAPITKHATTAGSVNDIGTVTYDAVERALSPHRGPVFVDYPMDVIFASGTGPVPDRATPRGLDPDPDDVAAAARLLAEAERPAIIVGTDLYFSGAFDELRAVVEQLRIPMFANGLGRGCLPADHELSFSRTRGLLKAEGDLVCVIGTPLDFRLGFGKFGSAQVVHIVDHPDQRATHTSPAVSPAGDLAAILHGIADHGGSLADHEPWIARLRDAERAAWAADEPAMHDERDPIAPARIYGEVRRVLDRDAIVVCDGGDFVSYAGKYIEAYQPGCWLDAGPYGCLGTGLGYLTAARITHPDRQVIAMMGDGAAGFSLLDVDTLVRHNLPVVMVVGNNGIWGLEKHPMQAIYGYDVAADLRPDTRYDQVVQALGGAGETVTRSADLGPALKRAFDSAVPYLVNVMTDPADVYPRTSNLG